jgi:hypothetical protein
MKERDVRRFMKILRSDGKRDLFLGNHAGGLAFFNSTNVNGVGIEELLKNEQVIGLSKSRVRKNNHCIKR